MTLWIVLGSLGAVLGAVLFFYLKGRSAGRDSLRADTAEEGLDRANRAREIEDRVAGFDADELDDRLRPRDD